MNKFGLIGHPLGHSMSPLIHKRLFELSGISDASYELIDIAPEDIADSKPALSKLRGFNVTIPHKQAVIRLTDELAESAQRYDSVNCISNENGKFIGYNTDCDGFLMSAEKLPLGEKVLMTGCGGVGRMIGIETARHGGELTIAVIPSDLGSAEKLNVEIKRKVSGARVTVTEISKLSESYDLMINATPVGMYPNIESCVISDEMIEKCGAFFDVIYNPKETLLMKKARALGKVAVGGASMLVYQAVKAHEIWYGGKFNADDVAGIITDVENAVDAMNK